MSVGQGAQGDEVTHRDERPIIGMTAAGAAIFMFSLMSAFAKALSDTHSVIEIAFYRNLIAVVPFAIIIMATGRRDIFIIRAKPHWVVTRAVLGSITLATTFAAYSLMPLAEVTVLLFTASLCVPVLGVLILKESVGPYRWGAIVVGFIGVAIMADPGGDARTVGILVALTAALMQATLQIILRYLGRHESPETISFYFFLIGTAFTGMAMPFVARQPDPADIPLFIGVGISGGLAQWLLSTAFRHIPVAVVSVFNYSGIVWATLLGWLLFDDWPMTAVFVGASIVIAANLLIVWRETRLGKLPVTVSGKGDLPGA